MIMKKNKLIVAVALFTVLSCAAVVFAQAPVVNIDRRRHGNLAAAQEYIVQAYQRMDKAQAANEDQLGGHAQRAKELLTQADVEIRLAANTANSEGR
jgi:hypothetical protein